MKSSVLWAINIYQKFISPDQGIFSSGKKYCVFEPSCSHYTKEAIEHGGVIYGIRKGILRIMRCHPLQKNIFDPFRP